MLCFDLLVKETVHSGRAAEENRVIALQGILFEKIRRDKVKLKAGLFFITQHMNNCDLIIKEKDRSCNVFYGFTFGLFFLKECAAAPSLSIIPAAFIEKHKLPT